ncbi:MAG: hypothetical protein KBC53_00250 [Nitrosomonas sp.]|nr:hypothetical protein [Nitrosomonas sp.]
MPPKTTDKDAPIKIEEPLGVSEAEAKAKADAEAAAKAAAETEDSGKANAEEAAQKAEEEPLDMSIDAQIARAQDDLNEAVDAQNQINRLVAEKTKAVDALIIEKSKSENGGPISDIQYYLQREARKRAEKVARRNQLLGDGTNALELIRQLDTRAPIDQRPAARKVDPRAVQPAKTTVNV